MVKRKNKKRIEYNGYIFKSPQEAEFARMCDRKKIVWEYESCGFYWQPPIQTYTPDFKIRRKDGSMLYVEYKGFLRKDDKIKLKCIKLQYPEMDLCIVFQNAKKAVHGAKKRKDGTKMSHAEWAEANGFNWSEGFISKKWLKPERKKKCGK